METTGFFRVITTGFINFWRNLWLSAAATMVMAITLVIFGVLFLMFALASYSIKTIQNTVDISVYFKTGLAEQRITDIENELKQDPKIKDITYVSAGQALSDFKTKHSSDPALLGSLDELSENPLPATLRIKAVSLEDYPEISARAQDSKYKDFITSVSFEDNRVIIERLSRILRFIVTVGAGLLAVFSLIAVLVIFNTITLTIYNRKEEIEIMRLVGATNWYIRGPFIIEAMLYSVFSTIISGALFYPVFGRILPRIAAYVNPQLTFFNQNLFNFGYLVLMLGIVSVLLAVFTTLIAVRKYLRI